MDDATVLGAAVEMDVMELQSAVPEVLEVVLVDDEVEHDGVRVVQLTFPSDFAQASRLNRSLLQHSASRTRSIAQAWLCYQQSAPTANLETAIHQQRDGCHPRGLGLDAWWARRLQLHASSPRGPPSMAAAQPCHWWGATIRTCSHLTRVAEEGHLLISLKLQ